MSQVARPPRIGDVVTYQGGEELLIAHLAQMHTEAGTGGVVHYHVAKLVTRGGFIRVPAFDTRRLAFLREGRWVAVPVTGAGYG